MQESSLRDVLWLVFNAVYGKKTDSEHLGKPELQKGSFSEAKSYGYLRPVGRRIQLCGDRDEMS